MHLVRPSANQGTSGQIKTVSAPARAGLPKGTSSLERSEPATREARRRGRLSGDARPGMLAADEARQRPAECAPTRAVLHSPLAERVRPLRTEDMMAFFLLQGRYSHEGIQALVANPQDRR